MKLLTTTIAAVVLVGCGESQPKPPDISIHDTAIDGNIAAVKQCIAAGADINAKIGGWTALHHAANVGNKAIVELLLAKGADVNAKDGSGRSPLDWAVNRNQAETADLLRKHGAKTGKELKAEGK